MDENQYCNCYNDDHGVCENDCNLWCHLTHAEGKEAMREEKSQIEKETPNYV